MSIKNKFATAVATASLLAGLFGSAFVPSAMGAVILPADTVIPRYTTLNEGPEVHQAGTTKSFGFQSVDSDDLAVHVDAYIDIDLFSAGNSGSGTDDYDLTANNNDEVVLKATSSNANVNIGWAYDNDTTDADSDGFVDSDACNGDITVGTSTSVVDVEGHTGAGDATHRLCFAGETDETAATSTITVTVDGVVATTFSVTAVGPVASITASITDGYKYIAEDNEYLEEWITLVAKDSAGVQINGSSNSVSNEQLTFSDWEDNPLNAQGDMVELFDNSMTGDDVAAGATTLYTGYDVDDNACVGETGAGEEDGDAGTSYSVKFEDGDVVSNAITITCTLNSDGARVTSLAPEATSGAKLYNETAAGSDDHISLLATVVDEDGVPLGDGATAMDFGWEFDGDPLLDFTSGIDTVRAFGGELLAGQLAPNVSRFGRFTYTVTAADSDLAITAAGDDAVAKDFVKTYTAINNATGATITKVRNAAKTSVTFTADMGEDAAFDVVTFTVELKNGTVVEYNRRANAIGIAKLSLSKRNTTIYVYASYLDDTNVMKCVFR